MQCPRCQHKDRPQAKFCEECGTPLTDLKDSGSYADLERALGEALEQQTATSEILRVISSSPTSVDAVFDTILANALRLCETPTGGVFTFDGQAFHLAAAAHWSDEFLAALQEAVIGPGPETPLRRVGLSLEVSHVADIFSDPSFSPPAPYRLEGMRTSLAVPMLKEGRLIGALTFHRREVRPFTEQQIALIKTFADQAVIAVENVRLFKELQAKNANLTESLEQQTATAEILRVISQSPTEVQPVFDTIVASAVRLCNARMGAVFRFDGELVHFVTQHDYPPEAVEVLQGMYPRPPQPDQASGRAILTRAVAEIEDMLADSQYRREVIVAGGWRSILAVPMLREGAPIGAIVINRDEPGRFSDGHIGLLKTFADQAVIAVENVRLFTELQEKNHALTTAHAQVSESLDQQTATSEVLKVISRSAFDLESVLETLIENAVRLCGASRGSVYRFDGDLLRHALSYNVSQETADFFDRNPLAPGRYSIAARVALERRTQHIPDILADSEYTFGVHQVGPIRTALGVPIDRKST